MAHSLSLWSAMVVRQQSPVNPLLLLMVALALLPLRPAAVDAEAPPPLAITGYVLPWEEGERWMCSQGIDGITHKENALYGFDFWRPYVEGAPVVATADGRVVKVINTYTRSTWPNRPFTSGNVVILDHGGGFYSQYAHLKQEGPLTVGSNPYVRAGQWVQRGERIASVGNTGSSSGAHLHFQVQNGPDEGAQSLPIAFADVPEGLPEAGRWYKPGVVLSDHLPPRPAGLRQPAGDEAVSTRTVGFQWTGSEDGESGVSHYLIRGSTADDLSGAATPRWIFAHDTRQDANPATTFYTFTFALDYPSIFWTVIAVDYAGNEMAAPCRHFALDTSPPTGDILIRGAAGRTVDTGVDLLLPADDGAGAVSAMMLSSHPDFVGAKWEPYRLARPWSLSGKAGLQTVYVKYLDRAGNQSPAYEAAIELESGGTVRTIWRQLQGLGHLFTPLYPSLRR